MFHSLRNRLIFSHILPALLVIPALGVVMGYVVENRILLPMVYRGLARDATLVAEITSSQPLIWQNQSFAQALVTGISPYLTGRVSFLTLDGRVLATTDLETSGLGAQALDLPDLTGIVQGQVLELQNGPLAEAFTPVVALDGTRLGAVRMTTRLVTVSDEIYQARYLLGAVLLLGVVAGIGLGSYLAFGINRQIQRLSHSIHTLADGNWQAHVDEQGPDEMRSLAHSVNVLVDRLNSLESARKQLLANLVHELGRPLGAIHSAIEALVKGAEKDPQLYNDLLIGMKNEIKRLQRLLEDLARLHDLVLGTLELKRQPVQPNAWLAGTLPAWAAAAHEKKLDWEADIPVGMPVVNMDPDRMAQALGNLLSNAIKFSTAGCLVKLKAGVVSRNFILQVSDQGMGIPIADQEHIFQPFFRGSQGRRIIQGMGLGLSIAREIVTAHGGEITMVSKPGSGSCFTISIPVGY